MPRLLLVSLPWMLACATPAHVPTTANRAPATTYELVPLSLAGPEGMHSASHSSSEVSGTLELAGNRASLALTFDTFVGHVHCPPGDNGVQACADPSVPDTQSKRSVVLRGDATVERGRVRATVRDGNRTLALACTPDVVGLACEVHDSATFGGLTALTFATPGVRRYDLAPVDVSGVGRIAGGVELRGGTARVALWADTGAPVYLPGTVRQMASGFVVSAQTSPTRTFVARCERKADALACEITVDRSVLGKPADVVAAVTLNPQRT